jgi:hypothetical protein
MFIISAWTSRVGQEQDRHTRLTVFTTEFDLPEASCKHYRANARAEDHTVPL